VKFVSRHFVFTRMSDTAITPTAAQEVTQEATTPARMYAYCRNCGAHAPGKFCGECGQETKLHPPSAWEFVHEFITHYIALEGKLWRTLGNLFFKPGKLTTEYLAGRKRRYVLPLRLYLTFSIIALFLVRAVVDVQGPSAEQFAKAFEGKQISVDLINAGSVRAVIKDGKFVCENLPLWMCERLRKRYDKDARGLAEEVSHVASRFMGKWGVAMFILLPLFALWLKLVYFKRNMRYGEHVVFTLHLHAFWFAMLIVMTALPQSVSDLAAFAIPVYAVWAMQRVYGGRWWATALRAGAVTFLYVPSLLFATVLLGLWILLF
jgi:hypothetical protein